MRISILLLLFLCSCGADPFKERTNAPGTGSSNAVGKSGESINFPSTDNNCICTAQYEPVCSISDGKTYSNICNAQCAGVVEFEQGVCP